MSDNLTLTGLVATPPRHLVTGEGLPITSFRLASTQRRYDRGSQKWIDGETNWFTVTCFRQLAINAVHSIEKGQRIVVTGKLRVRDWANGDRVGTSVEVDAEALGHDLAWGTSVFTRSISTGLAESTPQGSAEHSDVADEPLGDRPAVLDDASPDPMSGAARSESTAENTARSTAENTSGGALKRAAEARSKHPLEVALPF